MSDMTSVSYDAGKQIHADIYSRLNKFITPNNSFPAQVDACRNDSVDLLKQNFLASPDNQTVITDFVAQRMQASLSNDVREADPDNQNRTYFKNLLGILNLKADCFTSKERAIYDQVCRYLVEHPAPDGNVKSNRNDDKHLWKAVLPLAKKYGEEAMQDMMAKVIDVSVQAWCYTHKNADYNWALNNLDRVFTPSVRACFNRLDTQISLLKSDATGDVELRIITHDIVNALACIPKTLQHQMVPEQDKDKGATHTAPPASTPANNLAAPAGGGIPGIPGGITIKGAKANNYGCGYHPNQHTVPQVDDPWGKVSGNILGSNKLTGPQCFTLMKDLIKGMTASMAESTPKVNNQNGGERLAEVLRTPSPLLQRIQTIEPARSEMSLPSHQDVRERWQEYNGEGYRLGSPGHTRPATPELTSRHNDDFPEATPFAQMQLNNHLHRSRTLSLSSTASGWDEEINLRNPPISPKPLGKQPESPFMDELADVLTQRRSSSKGSGSDTSLSPKNVLDNFSFATLEQRRADDAAHKQNVEATNPVSPAHQSGSPLMQRRKVHGLNLTLEQDATKGGSGIINENERTDALSPRSALQRGTLEDFTLIKRWLMTLAQGSKEELRTIGALKYQGLRIDTLEHFLERAFLANLGTEQRSDRQQRIIKEAFDGLRKHDDYHLLSDEGRTLVERYVSKRTDKVFATSPTTRQSYTNYDSL